MVHYYWLLLVLFANRHSFLYGRNEPLVRYCFLWLLYGRGERFVQYCFLWRSCTDAGCHVYVPWVYHLAAKQGCTDVRVWLPKLGGLNIVCAHVCVAPRHVDAPRDFLIFILLFLFFLRTSSAQGGGGCQTFSFFFFSLFSRPRAGLATV